MKFKSIVAAVLFLSFYFVSVRESRNEMLAFINPFTHAAQVVKPDESIARPGRQILQ